jgi:hypothetical protein
MRASERLLKVVAKLHVLERSGVHYALARRLLWCACASNVIDADWYRVMTTRSSTLKHRAMLAL